MSKLGNKILILIVWLLFSFPCLTFSGIPQNGVMPEVNIENDKSESATLPANYTAEQIESILARLSDDQVRRLLIKELQKSASNLEVASQSGKERVMFSGFYRGLEDWAALAHKRMIEVASNIKNVPGDIAKAFQQPAERGLYGTLIILVIFAAGFGSEVIFKRLTAGFRKKIASVPAMDGFLKFWSAVLKFLPDLLGIIVFALISLFLFLLFYSASNSLTRLMFVHLLLAIMICRLVSAISRMICEPSFAKLRLVPLSDRASLYLHKNIVRLTWIMVLGFVISGLFYLMQIKHDSYITLLIATGTVAILMMAGMVWANRTAVAQAIYCRSTGHSGKCGLGPPAHETANRRSCIH